MPPSAKSNSKRSSSSAQRISPKRVVRRARELAREASRLLKRKRKKIEPAAAEFVQQRLDEVLELLPKRRRLGAPGESVDATQLNEASNRLDKALSAKLARFRKSTMREYAESIAWAVVLALLIRAFIFEAFSIPSGSMLPTLEIGDHLFVVKISNGVYVPFSPSRIIEWGQPDRGDIIVFEFRKRGDPHDGEDYIKRVVGTPGDRIRLVDNVLHINGEPIPTEVLDKGADPEWDGMCDVYREDDAEAPYLRCPCVRQRERLGEGDDRSQWDTEYITQHMAHVVGPLAEECRNRPSWSLTDYRNEPHKLDYFRPEACRNETLSQLGPLAKLVREACEAKASPDGELIVPDGHVFVMGDNRDRSEDGRFWGLVPFGRIKGQAFFIWYSRKWSRMFSWIE